MVIPPAAADEADLARRFQAGADLRTAARWAEAASVFHEVFELDRHGQLARKAAKAMLVAMRKAQAAPGLIEARAREALAVMPDVGVLHEQLGYALLATERRDGARESFEQALTLNPMLSGARNALAAMAYEDRGEPKGRRQRFVAWPKHLHGSVADQIRQLLLRGYPHGERFIRPSTRFVTLGSCFATNLCRRLQAKGYDCHTEFIGEEINSTYANRYLLEWIECGVVSPETQAMADAYGEDLRQRMRNAFAEADVFVFTLGLAPCFFDRADGRFCFVHGSNGVSWRYLTRRAVCRSTTVEENHANLRYILGAAGRLCRPGSRAVVTVSPVPLGATAEFESPGIADCLSKSILRVACHQAISEAGPDAHYWPSFEMVRWLGAHLRDLPEPVFGADDGSSRHVSNWLVDIIIELFLETYSVGPASAAQD